MIAVIENVEELKKLINANRKRGNTIGFIPTMGALHAGHISLIKLSKKNNNLTVVSIFVNPTQFNDKKDLAKYPRTLDEDIKKLLQSGADVLFIPNIDEVYPNGEKEGSNIDLGGLDAYMEGAFRPGHFKGVAQVVKRLLDIVMPNKLYMGQKDFQQFTIIQFMINKLNIQTELVVCPIMRERNGLAMSSRNERLSEGTRSDAKIIYKTLKDINKHKNEWSIEELIKYGIKKLTTSTFQPEYLSIVNGFTLEPIISMNQATYVIVCTAVWAEGVRLIDNIILKDEL